MIEEFGVGGVYRPVGDLVVNYWKALKVKLNREDKTFQIAHIDPNGAIYSYDFEYLGVRQRPSEYGWVVGNIGSAHLKQGLQKVYRPQAPASNNTETDEPSKTLLADIKVGDMVYSLVDGWCPVTHVSPDGVVYDTPHRAKHSYPDGKESTDNLYPSVFPYKVDIAKAENSEPPQNYRYLNGVKLKPHVTHLEDGCCYFIPLLMHPYNHAISAEELRVSQTPFDIIYQDSFEGRLGAITHAKALLATPTTSEDADSMQTMSDLKTSRLQALTSTD